MNFQEYLGHYKQVIDKEVEGWFYPKDLILLYGILVELQTPDMGDVCEIGVAFGKSAIALSQFRLNSKLYLYDIFSEDARKIAEANIQKFGNVDNIVWNLQDTTQLNYDDLKFDRSLRLLHIDGCHEHSAVLSDLQLFSPVMADNGVIVVDDYNDQEYPGVKSAVIEFCLSKANYKNWKIIAIGDNKAYIVQKKFQEHYQKSIVDYMVKAHDQYNVPFVLRMGLREVLDTNVLMCDSRTVWDPRIIKESLFDKPMIG